jgi:signal transduction histidine kinase/CheY-like chemotaxis protein
MQTYRLAIAGILFILLCIASAAMIAFSLRARGDIAKEYDHIKGHTLPLLDFRDHTVQMERWLLMATTGRTAHAKRQALAEASQHERLARARIRSLVFDHSLEIERHNALVTIERSLAKTFLSGQRIAEQGDEANTVESRAALARFDVMVNTLSEQVHAIVDEESASAQQRLRSTAEELQLIIGLAAAGLVGFIVIGGLGWITFVAYARTLQSEVSERKVAAREAREARAEAERHAEAAQAADRAKSNFLANMSHELRTPMNGISGMSELLMGSELKDRQREWVSTISSSVHHQLTVIDDILEFSHIEAGRVQTETQRFDLYHLIYESINLLRERIDYRSTTLLVDIEERLPHWWNGDPGRTRQVLLNLMGNAIKFTPRGEILVEASRTAAGFRISISDTGIGIDPTRLDQLFEPFVQADEGRARRYGGVGLGLSISRRLAQALGGTISATSEPAVGSCFTLELPFTVNEDQSSDADGLSTDHLAGKRVLVVDAHPRSRDILARQIRSFGAEVTASPDHMQILTFGSSGCDLAIIEADLSGPDAASAITAMTNASATPPILGLLPLATTGDDNRLAAGGFAGVVQKNMPAATVAQTIRSVLDKQAQSQTEASAPAPSEKPSEKPAEKPPGALDGLNCLVAEDNLVNQRVIRQLLKVNGADVRVADDGFGAVARFFEERPDVVLMDLQMPGMDGLEATREIRRREHDDYQSGASNVKRTPIIAVTANVMASDQDNCMAAGMDAFVPKPVRIKELVRVILQQLDRVAERK